VSRRTNWASHDHAAVAANAREERGTWLLAGTYGTRASAASAAKKAPKAQDMPAYAPAGSFEAYAAMSADGWALWVRYVAGDEPVPELPERMTVRVCDWLSDREADGVGVVTVTVAARCATCGGPRGHDAVTPQEFTDGGVEFTVDRWTNPCGHLDTYDAILQEARFRPLPEPSSGPAGLVLKDVPEPPAPGSPAGVVLAAADAWRGMRAKAAIEVLDRHGFAEDADRVATMLRKARTHGHVSARQIAHWLHVGGDV
jgi:hypothetical protein